MNRYAFKEDLRWVKNMKVRWSLMVDGECETRDGWIEKKTGSSR